jgi:REP element-mobilizing transposase RayT
VPRRPRVFVDGGTYHVYNPFARGADLFSEPEEAIQFLEITRKERDRDGLSVLAWCLMPNQHHLALRTGAVPLARTMGYVQSRLGQGYNKRHRSSRSRRSSQRPTRSSIGNSRCG